MCTPLQESSNRQQGSMSNETRGFTACNICGLNSNNYKIAQHSKHCKALNMQTIDAEPDHDPESVQNTDPDNDSHSCSDSASSSDSSHDIDENNNEGDMTMFADEVEMTVDDYINNLTDESRQEILYNPAIVLRYMAWRRRELTDQEKEVLKFLRCVSFGNGLSHAHTKEFLHYVRSLGGKASLLPRSVVTLWKVMQNAHCSMSDEICRRTIDIPIPLEVRSYYNFCNTFLFSIFVCTHITYIYNKHFIITF